MSIDLKKLAAKFDPQDIEWRVQQAGLNGNKPWVMAIPYITNRAIQQRLDDVVGVGMWQDEYRLTPCGTGYLCGISILIDGRWVTKWDGAKTEGNGGIDQVKSTCSNSEKRAGVKWGIGRYLYQLETSFANCMLVDKRSETPAGWNYQESPKSAKNKYKIAWENPPLPSWAMPQEDPFEYIESLKNSKSMDELKFYWQQFYNLAKSLNDLNLMNEGENVKGELKIKFEEQEKQRLEDEKIEAAKNLEVRVSNMCELFGKNKNQHSLELALTKYQQEINESCDTLGIPPEKYQEKIKIAFDQKIEKLKQGAK